MYNIQFGCQEESRKDRNFSATQWKHEKYGDVYETKSKGFVLDSEN